MPTIEYESTAGEPAGRPRPVWVYVVVGVYGLLMAGLLAIATVLPISERESSTYLFAGTVIVLLLWQRFGSRARTTR